MMRKTKALFAVALFAACGSSGPSDELMMSSRTISLLDQRIVKYGCPDQRQLYNEPDPFLAAAEFVRLGKEQQGWTPDPNDRLTGIPADISDGIDSLRASVAEMGKGFDRAAGWANFAMRECYGEFALRCDKRARAYNTLYLIDTRIVQSAFDKYLRHRQELVRDYERQGVTINPPPTCTAPR